MSSILQILYKVAIIANINFESDGDWQLPFNQFAAILMNPEYSFGPHYETFRTVKEKWDILKMYGQMKNQYIMVLHIPTVKSLLRSARLIE